MSNRNHPADRHKDDTEQAQFWRMVIETHQDSGLSVRAFLPAGYPAGDDTPRILVPEEN